MTQGEDNWLFPSLSPQNTMKIHRECRTSHIHYLRCAANYHLLGFFASSKHLICVFTANMLPSPYFRFLSLDGLWLKEKCNVHQGIAKSFSFLDVEVTNFVSFRDPRQSFIPFETLTDKTILTHADKFLLCLTKTFQLDFNNISAFEFYCH